MFFTDLPPSLESLLPAVLLTRVLLSRKTSAGEVVDLDGMKMLRNVALVRANSRIGLVGQAGAKDSWDIVGPMSRLQTTI